MPQYYFILASKKFLLEEEPVEEILRERTNNYKNTKKEVDFWLVIDEEFLKQKTLFNIQLPEPSAAIISSNKVFINWLKLRLGFVALGDFKTEEPILLPVG